MPYSDPAKQREYMRQWYARRRQEWIDQNGPCSLCGAIEALEVHHLDPEQKVTHRVWSWSEERRLAELAKCTVLCEPCHERVTSEWYAERRTHGSHNTFDRHGCRCDPCVLAKQAHNAQRDREALGSRN